MLLALARRRCAYTNDMLTKSALLLEVILDGATYLSVVVGAISAVIIATLACLLLGYLHSVTLHKNS